MTKTAAKTAAKTKSSPRRPLKGEPLRVLLGPGETGWVRLTSEGFEVCNIPLNPRLNYGDLVSLRLPPTRPGRRRDAPPMAAVDRVLDRSFRRKTTLWYDQPKQFGPLVKRLRAAGAMTEGAVGPMLPKGKQGKPRRGFLMVAYNAPTNPVAIAREAGIDRPRSKESRP